jgi:hypothetical protein
MKKCGKLECHMVDSNNAIDSLSTFRISLGIVALFENIYDRELIFTDFSNIGEDVQYHYFNVLYYCTVRIVSQPNIDDVLKNNYVCK